MRSQSIVRRLLAVTAAGSILAVAAVASAENKPQAQQSKKDECAETQGANASPAPDTRYCFISDPLSAGTEGPNEVLIKIGHRFNFTTLIRPRLHFVPELLRSAQQF